MPRLKGGHVIVTARASNFPAGFRKLELGVLEEGAAAQFLLDRTETDRAKGKDDMALAGTLAGELGGLALGLEQAGAHIATDRIGFARYLKSGARAGKSARLGGCDGDRFRSDAGHDLGDIGRAARAGELGGCLTGSPSSRPTRFRTRSSTSPFPARRRVLTPIKRWAASTPIPSFRRERQGRRRAGLRRSSPRAGLRPPRDERRAARRRLCARRWSGSAQPLSAIAVTLRTGQFSIHSRRTPSPLRGMPTKAEIAAPTARLFNDVGVLLYVKADYTEAERFQRAAR